MRESNYPAEFESYLESMHQPRSVAPNPSGTVLIMSIVLIIRIIYFKTQWDFIESLYTVILHIKDHFLNCATIFLQWLEVQLALLKGVF